MNKHLKAAVSVFLFPFVLALLILAGVLDLFICLPLYLSGAVSYESYLVDRLVTCVEKWRSM